MLAWMGIGIEHQSGQQAGTVRVEHTAKHPFHTVVVECVGGQPRVSVRVSEGGWWLVWLPGAAA